MIVELSKSLPVEVNYLAIELGLPVDSQYSLPVKVLNLKCIQQQFFFNVLGKYSSIWIKLPTAVCWSQEKRGEGVKLT